jgi:hypothetical protein
MASTTETKKEGSYGGRRHGPPTEEERQKWEAEFKQEFQDEYRKQYGDESISAEQTWELYQTIKERWFAKKKERHHSSSRSRSRSPQHGDHHGFEEKRKQLFAELQQDFQKDYTAAHGTNKINAEQAWSLFQKVKQNKREKWAAKREKHGWGKHESKTEEERQQREAELKQEFFDEYHKQHGDQLISAEQTWEFYQTVKEHWMAKKKDHHHFEEKRKQHFAELQQDFQKDYTAAHGTNKINAEQAWLLIQKVQQNKREKWAAKREKHGWGKHEPKTEEERQQREAELKREFQDEYRKQYGDESISAEQTWKLYRTIKERWFAKKKERHHSSSRSRSRSPQHGDHHGFEEKRKQFFAELQQDFQKDYTAAHDTNKINAEQAWSLFQKVKQNKREKWAAKREKHGWGKHEPKTEEERQQREAELKQEFQDEYHKQHGDELISAEQTWEFYRAVKEHWMAKKKDHHHFEEKRNQIFAELHQDFQKDYTAAHGTNKVNADQAWLLIQKVQQIKRERWAAHREKYGQHSSPANQ